MNYIVILSAPADPLWWRRIYAVACNSFNDNGIDPCGMTQWGFSFVSLWLVFNRCTDFFLCR
jgi:hypothetical protein